MLAYAGRCDRSKIPACLWRGARIRAGMKRGRCTIAAIGAKGRVFAFLALPGALLCGELTVCAYAPTEYPRTPGATSATAACQVGPWPRAEPFSI